MALTSLELWNRALQGEEVARADIEHMLRAHTPEDLWLDWKGGAIVGKDNASKVREAVAGFANAEGGVLVLGANGGDVGTGEAKWTVTPCPAKIGKQSLQEWVEQQLVPLRPGLRPLPRITLIDDDIVLIAVQRSELLVPVVLPNRGPTYFLRFFGSTHEVPGYLLADLVLGRRQRPRLDVRIVDVTIGEPVEGSASWSERELRAARERRQRPWQVAFAIEVHNSGLVWAQDVTCGLVFHGAAFDERNATGPEQHVPPSVSENTRGRHVGPFHLEHRVLERQGDLAPFETLRFQGISGWTPSMMPAAEAWKEGSAAWWHTNRPGPTRPAYFETNWRIHWLAPLYVLTRNGPPQWFQVDVVFDENQSFLDAESSIEAVDERPAVDIQAEHRSFDRSGWVQVAGWGPNPLAPRT